MIDRAHFLIFLSAAVVLAVSRGRGMIYVLARSLRGGRAIGLASCLGTAAGGLVHVLAAGLGLSVILARSASAFLVVKYLGAAYLLYLGIRTLAARDSTFPTATVEQDAGRPFWQGMLTEVLNPKTALFFLALIPQFINHTASVVPQFLLLGAISVTHEYHGGHCGGAGSGAVGATAQILDSMATTAASGIWRCVGGTRRLRGGELTRMV